MKTYTYEEVLDASTQYFKGDNLAANAFTTKYALRNKQNEYLELTPDDMHKRLAKEFARIEKKIWHKAKKESNSREDFVQNFNQPLSYDFLYELFSTFTIVPQGSPMYGIGNNYTVQSLGNCFTIGKHPLDSYGGILYADQMIVQLSKRRCGVGLQLDNLRPKGLNVANAAQTTDGIGVFMERFSNSTREVAQSGRRGALLMGLSVHHPEIETFITIKENLQKVTGANISVMITDEFMDALYKEEQYEQRWPIDSNVPEVSNMVSAKHIWDLLMEMAHKCAEPGIMFIDRIREMGLSHQYGSIDERFMDMVTNPCYHPDTMLLTDSGYKRFYDLYKSEEYNKVLTDNRISYFNGNWEFNHQRSGTRVREASPIKKTGKNKKILNVELQNGMTLKVTKDHHIATTDGMIEAQDLTLNHKVLVSVPDCDKTARTLPTSVSEIDAYLMGMIAGDGHFATNGNGACLSFWGDNRQEQVDVCCEYIQTLYNLEFTDEHKKYKTKLAPYSITEYPDQNKTVIKSASLGRYLKDRYNFTKKTKHNVPKILIESCRSKAALYYLNALYYCDGSVQGSQSKGFSVRLAQSNKKMLADIQLMLHANGIVTSLYKRRDAHTKVIKGKKCNIKTQYELVTRGNHHIKFYEKLSFLDSSKNDKLLNIYTGNFRKPKSNFAIKVREISSAGTSDVFCLEEPITKSVIANGISARRCGELPIGLDSCRLLLINLFKYVKDPFTKNATFDNATYEIDCMIAQRLMDAMVELEIEKIDRIIKKVKEDPEDLYVKQVEIDMWQNYKETAIAGRRTGLGITGLGDALAACNIKYGNKKSIESTRSIYQTLAHMSLKSSCLMAKELGAFPIFNEEIEKDHPWLKKIFGENKELQSLHQKYGRRNISLTTTAPAGTVSLLTQTTSGIEPVFLLEYTRRRKLTRDATTFDFQDELGDKWEHYQVSHHGLDLWKKANPRKSITKSPYHGATSADIDWEASVALQGAAQEYVTHSISKTCNLPKDTTVETVDKVYRKAYETGCKGFTIYRDGSRSGVLVSNEEQETKDRPTEIECDVYHLTRSGIRYVILIGLIDGKPYEMFGFPNRKIVSEKVKKGKIIKLYKGSKYRAEFDNGEEAYPITSFMSDDEETFSRMCSLLLRENAPIEDICRQLSKIGGHLGSFAKATEKVLSNYINGSKSGDKCPQCEADLVYIEGCKTCSICEYSAC